jgi:hypothetical protein
MTIDVVTDFAAAVAITRAEWHKATPAQRFDALARLRYIAYGKTAATARLQRLLEVVSGS